MVFTSRVYRNIIKALSHELKMRRLVDTGMNHALQNAQAEIESLEQEAYLLRQDRWTRDERIRELEDELDHANDILDMLQTVALSQLKST